MNWRRLRILYEMESKRISSYVMPLIFSVIISFLLIQWLFGVKLLYQNEPEEYLSSIISSFLMYFFLLFGMSVSLLYIVELKSDETRGIVDTFITYPVGRGDFALAKLMVYGLNISITTLIIALIFLIFSGNFLIFGLGLSLTFILGILLILLCSFSISFVAAVFIRYSPLSEIIPVFYFVGGFLINLMTSNISAEKLVLFLPFSVLPGLATGMYEDPTKMIIYLSISIFAYLEIIHLTYIWLNTYKRRALE